MPANRSRGNSLQPPKNKNINETFVRKPGNRNAAVNLRRGDLVLGAKGH